MAIYRNGNFRDVLDLIKALGDENRLRIFMMLRHGELCVCQIIEMLELAPSTVSKHLSILKQARLIESRKNGRWIYYRLADNDSSLALRNYLEKQLHQDSRINSDDKALKQLRKLDPEQICQRHHQK
jgi:ArsR family transcriptional regulator, arsenate/arsenite/antimonite-responsive transcriptional repressor